MRRILTLISLLLAASRPSAELLPQVGEEVA